MKKYSYKYGKKLRNGFTTGTAAAAASMAAVKVLCGERDVSSVSILLPSDDFLEIPVTETWYHDGAASASVMVDGGDDRNVLDKCIVKSCVKKADEFIISAGSGVGTVTRPGLSVKVGSPAINPVPLRMIEQSVRSVDNRDYNVEISVVNGEELAKKTLNEKLGIIGGVSIIGTTGITEPMSNSGFVDSMYREIDMMLAKSLNVTVVSGNYGYDFALNNLGIEKDRIIKVSNFVGEALFYLKSKGAENILMIGHAGKFVKIAGGNFNTHSYISDSRMEIISSAVLKMTGDTKSALKVLDSNTTDEAYLAVPEERRRDVFDYLSQKALTKIHQIIKFDNTEVRFGLFNSKRSLIGCSEGFRELAGKIND